MGHFLTNRWHRAMLALVVAFLAGTAARANAQDTDLDGMPNNYELFFGLNPTNPTDASLDLDGDVLSNLGESGLWTDPFSIDTDRDGWIDGWHDAAPLSRAVMCWGNPRWTSGTNYDYTGPAWWYGGEREGGVWLTNGWYCSATDGVVGTELRIPIERSLLTNSLVMSLTYFDYPGSQLYVDLIRTNGLSTALNLYGNLISGSSTIVSRIYVVPVTNDTQTAKIQLRRAWGAIQIYCTTLYIDRDLDGLDDAQELQAGTDPLYTNGIQAYVPGRIEAENFGPGGEGRGYHDIDTVNSGGAYRPGEGVDIEATTDAGGGYDVGWTRQGEWLEYTAMVTNEGLYRLTLRVAQSESNSWCHVEVDGINVSGPIAIPLTGGPQVWQTIAAGATYLGAGLHVVRLKTDAGSASGGGGNFNYIDMGTLAMVTSRFQNGISPASYTGCVDSTLRSALGYTFGMQAMGKTPSFDPRWKDVEGTGIIRFDLSSIPSNAIIYSAMLRMWFAPNEFDASGRFLLQPLHDPNGTGMWQENGVSNNATYLAGDPTVAAGCALYKRPNMLWSSTSDGRFNTVISSNEIRAAQHVSLVTNWISFDVSADIAQFVASPAQNLGWVCNNEFDSTVRGLLYTADCPVPTNRPVLEIVYATPSTSNAGTNPANPIVLIVNAPPVGGTIAAPAQQDWYSFVAASTGAYSVVAPSVTLTDKCYLVVFGPNNYTNVINPTLTQNVFLATTPGTYYVRASAWLGSALGTYTIRVIAGQPPYVNYFSVGNWDASTPSAVVSVTNDCAGSPTQYMISESSNFVGAAWQAYASGSSFTLSTNPGMKTVYFKVQNAYWTSPAVSDSIQYAPPVTLTVNAPAITGAISVADEEDWYTFSAASTGAYTLMSAAITITDQVFMIVYGPSNYTSSIIGARTQATFMASSVGTYYTRVRGWNGSPTGTYSLRVLSGQPPYVNYFSLGNWDSSTPSPVVSVTNDCGGSPTQYMISESSNFVGAVWQAYTAGSTFTLSTNPGMKTVYFKVQNAYWASPVASDSIQYAPPTTLTVNAPAITGVLAVASEEKWYTFNAASTGAYTLMSAAITMTDQVFMIVYGPSNYTSSIVGGRTQATFIATGAGTYYTRVRAWNGSPTGTYSLSVLAGQPPYVQWMAIQNWDASTPSATVTLTNQCMGDPTQYTASESSNFVGASWLAYAGSPTFTLSPTGGIKTVYFKVRNAYWESQVTSDLIQYAPPVALTVNAAATTGALSVASEQDWFTFSAASTGIYNVVGTSLTMTDKCYMIVYGPNNYTSGVGAGLTQAVCYVTAAGTYYVRLQSLYWATGTYTIAVETSAPQSNQAPVVSAGSSQAIILPAAANLSGTATDDGLPSNKLTVAWSIVSGPGTVAFGNSTSFVTTASFSTNGAYVLRLVASDTALSSTGTVAITVSAAGSSNLVGWWAFDEGAGTSASNSVAGGAGGTLFNMTPTWVTGTVGKALSFDGLDDYVEIANSPNLENVQEGNYTVCAWFKPNRLPPGTNSAYNSAYGIVEKQGWHEGLAYYHDGTFDMDHWLTGDIWAGTGSAYHGPGTNYFVVGVVDRVAGTVRMYINGVLEGTGTFASNTAAREYNQIPWRIGTGGVPPTGNWGYPAEGVIDEAQIYSRALSGPDVTLLFQQSGGVIPTNQAPVVSAGTNQIITLPSVANLSGSVTDDALPSNRVTVLWSVVSGSGTVAFASATSLVTTATFSTNGIKVLRLTASDGLLTSTSTVQVTVNLAPVVNAGTNQTITLPSAANLSATATDDGLPSNKLTIAWSKASGTGTVTFGSATSLVTTATFSTGGVYVLGLAVGDGAASSTGSVTITVNAAPTNVAPVIQSFLVTSASNFCNEGSVQLQATATDANGDAISYQLYVQGSVLSAWSTNRTATWQPGLTNAGPRTFTVAVRDPSNATNQLSQTNFIFRTPPRP